MVLYILLSGQLPFPGTKNRLYCSIVNGAFTVGWFFSPIEFVFSNSHNLL